MGWDSHGGSRKGNITAEQLPVIDPGQTFDTALVTSLPAEDLVVVSSAWTNPKHDILLTDSP